MKPFLIPLTLAGHDGFTILRASRRVRIALLSTLLLRIIQELVRGIEKVNGSFLGQMCLLR